MIPLPKWLDIRGWADTTPLNGTIWSLQWEYVANILYALVIRKMGKRLLMFCVMVFAAFTVMLCMQIDLFGFLSSRDALMCPMRLVVLMAVSSMLHKNTS